MIRECVCDRTKQMAINGRVSKFQKYFLHILKILNIFYNFIAIGNRSKFQNTLYIYAQYIKADLFTISLIL